jgi:hypothetical protein
MSERSEIRRDGSKAQKNSGRGPIQKGDSKLYPFVIDYKEYPKGFRVTPDVWAKICGDAWRSDGEPALKLVMGQDNQKVRVVVISESMSEEMRKAWRDMNGG